MKMPANVAGALVFRTNGVGVGVASSCFHHVCHPHYIRRFNT
jgi:hypothetical protein